MATTIPQPRTGQGAYGLVPGAVTDVDPTQLFKFAYPTLGQDLTTAQGNIGSQLRGELPDDTARDVWDRRAAVAAAGGVAGSGFTGANTARDLGLTRLQLQQQGGENLNSMLSTLYPTAIAPTVDLAQTNAELGAAPDPQLATQQQQRTFAAQQQAQFQNQLALMNAQIAAQQRAATAATTPRRQEYSQATIDPITGARQYQYRYLA